MIKQFIQKAKIKFFEPDEPSGTVIHLPARQLEQDLVTSSCLGFHRTADQQRIKMLEIQNQQLRADIARCQNSSLGFAREMRKLLAD